MRSILDLSPWFVLLVLLVLFGVIGCGGQPQPAPRPAPQPGPQPAPQPPPQPQPAGPLVSPDGHVWYYYPAMEREEALLIKQWDSYGEFASSSGTQGDSPGSDLPCTFSFHSAFEDPETPANAPDRWSIEVRCAVLYDSVGL